MVYYSKVKTFLVAILPLIFNNAYCEIFLVERRRKIFKKDLSKLWLPVAPANKNSLD